MRSDSQRTVLWFSENCAQIKIFNACLFKGSQEQSFFLQTLLFTAFLVTVLKFLTNALWSTWSLVSSRQEHVKQKKHSWWSVVIFLSFMEWCPSGPLIIHNLVQTRRSKGIETNSSKSKICWKWKNNKLKTNSSKSKIKNNQQRNLWGHLWWSESQSYMFPFN